MKKISCYTLMFALLSFTSCSLFEVDNYPEPGETLRGQVVDVETGEPVLTDQGSEGIRVRLTELSWGDNVTPNDFYCMPDGNFQNTKVFKGHYNIRIDGPFIPLLREDDRGVPLADETKEMDISGVTEVKFEVHPFLKVEWVGEPEIVNGVVKAQVRVSRAVSAAEFQSLIEPMGGYSATFLNVTDVQFMVSYSSSVGWRARDTRWSTELLYTGTSFNALLGQTITVQSNPANPIPAGRAVFIRAAARINFDTPKGSGTRRWNYNAPKQLLVP